MKKIILISLLVITSLLHSALRTSPEVYWDATQIAKFCHNLQYNALNIEEIQTALHHIKDLRGRHTVIVPTSDPRFHRIKTVNLLRYLADNNNKENTDEVIEQTWRIFVQKGINPTEGAWPWAAPHLILKHYRPNLYAKLFPTETSPAPASPPLPPPLIVVPQTPAPFIPSQRTPSPQRATPARYDIHDIGCDSQVM